MEKEHNRLIKLVVVMGIIVAGMVGYFLYLYYTQEDPVADTASDTTTEASADTTDYSELDADDAVDTAIDEVIDELEDLDTDEDFEDFDSELEFGVEL